MGRSARADSTRKTLTEPTLTWATAAVFAVTYLGLAAGRVPGLRTDRAGIAFVGAALVLAMGLLPLREAAGPESLDYETLFLLLGMMLVVGALRVAGFFDLLAGRALARVRTPRALLAAVVLTSGLLSAALVNDVVCVALAPLVLHLARRLRTDPVPHLMALATAANVGSAGAITGNPQNMIIGVKSAIAYGHFAARLMPVALAGLVACYAVLSLVYRKALASQTDAPPLPAEDLRHLSRRPYRVLLYKSVLVALAAVGLLLAGLPMALVAVAGAAVTLLGGVAPRKLYAQIDWSLLLMFVGLFILTHAFQVRVVSHWDVAGWAWVGRHPVALLGGASAALSNLVSNVPGRAAAGADARRRPAATPEKAWLALSVSSTFAGNLTLLGSVANLIVVESARREGVEIGFWEYCRAGLPITLLTLGMGVGWLMLT